MHHATQLFPNGELWSVSDDRIVIREHGDRPLWVPVPLVAALTLEEVFYKALHGNISFAANSLGLTFPCTVELGLLGLANVRLGIQSGDIRGPIRVKEVIVRRVLGSADAVAINAVLLEFFNEVHDKQVTRGLRGFLAFLPVRRVADAKEFCVRGAYSPIGADIPWPKDLLCRYTQLPALFYMLSAKKLTLLDPNPWDDKNDSYFLEQYKSKRDLKTVLPLCFSMAPETYHHWSVFAEGLRAFASNSSAMSFWPRSRVTKASGTGKYGRRRPSPGGAGRRRSCEGFIRSPRSRYNIVNLAGLEGLYRAYRSIEKRGFVRQKAPCCTRL